MKEITSRNAEKFLKFEEKEDGKYHYCPYCGQLLLTIYKNNEWGMMSSCGHFDWYEFTITLYSMYMKLLMKNAIITIFDDISVYLLAQRQS